MSEFTIFHNPRCSKSRQTLELLRDNGVEPDIILYLAHPPSPDELKALLGKLGLSATDLLRKKEALAVELDLAAGKANDETIVTTMSKHPVLIERPIVVRHDKAVLGRPPENVLEFFK